MRNAYNNIAEEVRSLYLANCISDFSTWVFFALAIGSVVPIGLSIGHVIQPLSVGVIIALSCAAVLFLALSYCLWRPGPPPTTPGPVVTQYSQRQYQAAHHVRAWLPHCVFDRLAWIATPRSLIPQTCPYLDSSLNDVPQAIISDREKEAFAQYHDQLSEKEKLALDLKTCPISQELILDCPVEITSISSTSGKSFTHLFSRPHLNSWVAQCLKDKRPVIHPLIPNITLNEDIKIEYGKTSQDYYTKARTVVSNWKNLKISVTPKEPIQPQTATAPARAIEQTTDREPLAPLMN